MEVARVGVVYTIGGWFVDVHTQPSDELGNIVGRVLHVGVDRPQLIEVVIDGIHYRGFVSSYHEVVTGGFERLDDAWMADAASEGALEQVGWLDPIAPEP